MLERLQKRWNTKSSFQVVVILIVFACTGFTIYFLKRPILAWIFGPVVPAWARVLYYVLILPIYNLLLLCYGFVFGQFRFFWEFEKRFFTRIGLIISGRKNV